MVWLIMFEGGAFGITPTIRIIDTLECNSHGVSLSRRIFM